MIVSRAKALSQLEPLRLRGSSFDLRRSFGYGFMYDSIVALYSLQISPTNLWDNYI